jgi:hypothetical protein
VLISAAMLRQAKYVERKGFFVNHLYGTVTRQTISSRSFIRRPAKNAFGNFESKNILNFKGCFSDLMNADALTLIDVF